MAPSYCTYTNAICPDVTLSVLKYDRLMNFNKITCAFLLVAPLDACVLNHTLIGVGLAARQPNLYTLQI